jgi:OOP family OmpA-OmpF porin
LRGVKFRTNSAALTTQSKYILDKAATTLVGAPHVRVEVQAHTCNLGRADYNEDLSRRRALSVRDYLVNKGVSIDRMEANGYGERQPTASNETKAGRHKNRRVELLVID